MPTITQEECRRARVDPVVPATAQHGPPKIRTATVALLLIAAGLIGLPSTSFAAATRTLGGVPVLVGDAHQVITLNRSSGTHAVVSLWERRSRGWERIL